MINYDDIAAEFDAYGKTATTDIVLGYGAVMELLGDVRGKKVLDYGCGTGKFSRILKDAGAEVVGVDISEKELAIAKERHPDIPFYVLSGMPAELDGTFDVAVLIFIITAIPNTTIVESIFNDLKKFLKTHGQLVLMNSNYEKSAGREFLTFSIGDVKQELLASLKVFLGFDKSLAVDEYFYPREFLFEKLQAAGFAIEKTYEPLATTTDHPWKDEKVSPPFFLISAIN